MSVTLKPLEKPDVQGEQEDRFFQGSVGGWNDDAVDKIYHSLPQSPEWKVLHNEKIHCINLNDRSEDNLTCDSGPVADKDNSLAIESARPLSARQLRYLNKSRQSNNTEKTKIKAPPKRIHKKGHSWAKESPLVTLRRPYIKPRATNPAETANNSVNKSSEPAFGASMISIHSYGLEGNILSSDSTCTFEKAEPISASKNFMPHPKLPRKQYNDHMMRALAAGFQVQMEKQRLSFHHHTEKLKEQHEQNLANVVLAYDSRTSYLEQECKKCKKEESLIKQQIERATKIEKRQYETINRLRQEIMLLKTRSSTQPKQGMVRIKSQNSSNITSPNSLEGHRLYISILPKGHTSSPDDSKQMGWHSPLSNLETYEDDSDRGGAVSDCDDGNNDNADDPRPGSHLMDRYNSGKEDKRAGSPGSVSHMQEEIRHYQDALAESAQKIETLQNTNWQEVVRLRDSEASLRNRVHELESAHEKAEHSFEAESKKCLGLQADLETSRTDLQLSKAEVDLLQAKTLQMQADHEKLKRDVEASEAKISAQLRDIAIAMKQTLKQCHMLEELIRPEITCNHCMEILREAQVLYPCGHSFCDECVDDMERESDQCIVCSICQTVVPRADTCSNVALQAICPRVAWWSEPIALLKQQFQDFSGRDFVVQQTFGTMPTNSQSKGISDRIADEKTVKTLVRVAFAIKEANVGVAELFESFDVDHGGTVDHREMNEGLHSIGMWLSDEEFERLMKCADPDNDGEVKYTEFAELLDHALTTREGRDMGAAREALAVDPAAEAARRKGY